MDDHSRTCLLCAAILDGVVVPMECVREKKATVGVWDIPLALASPRRVFARVEDVPAYGWPLLLLLVTVTLIGYAYVETGLIDRTVDRRVQERIAALEEAQLDVVERSALSKQIEEQLQAGEFERLMERIAAVVVRPITSLGVVLLIPAFFYGVVALTGKKPEWHTLITICVFASFADVLGAVMRLVLMLSYRTVQVDTSLGVLARWMESQGATDQASVGPTFQSVNVLAGLLSAVDPFRIWFWLIVITGLSATSQLRGWKVWVTVSLLWMSAAGVRAGLAIASRGL